MNASGFLSLSQGGQGQLPTGGGPGLNSGPPPRPRWEMKSFYRKWMRRLRPHIMSGLAQDTSADLSSSHPHGLIAIVTIRQYLLWIEGRGLAYASRITVPNGTNKNGLSEQVSIPAMLVPVCRAQEPRFGIRQAVWVAILAIAALAVMRLLLAK